MNYEKYRVRWIFNTSNWKPSQEEWEKCLIHLPKQESERINKFRRKTKEGLLTGRFNQNAKDSTAGLLMLKKFCKETLQIESLIDFKRTEEGKPYLNLKLDIPNLNFNISHDGNFVIFVSDIKATIGADIMEIILRQNSDTIENFFELMECCFTINEWKMINGGLDEYEKLKRFYTFWTLKESYIKAIGIGLGFELKRAEFIVDDIKNPTSAHIYIDGLFQKDWKFEIHYVDNYVISIAYGNPCQIIDSCKSLISNIDDISKNYDISEFSRISFQQLDVESCIYKTIE